MKQPSLAPFLRSGIRAADYPTYQFWCLLPSVAWGCFRYGWYAIVIVAVALAATVGTDWLASRWRRVRVSLADAALTGLLIAACLPPEAPLYVPVVAGVAAVVLGYLLLGGPSAAWLSPAGLGLVVVLVSWPVALLSTTIHLGSGATALSPMSSWYNLLAVTPIPGQTPSDFASLLAASAYPEWLAPILSWIHSNVRLPVPDHLVSSFLGLGYGPIGLTSPALLLMGSVFMFSRGVGDWRPTAAAFTVFAVLTWLFGGLAWGIGLGHGDILFFMMNGSLVLVLGFMMHNNAALPLTGLGRTWYGAFLGLVLWVVLVFGRLELGAVLALVFANIWVPLIDARSRLRAKRQVTAP